LTEAFNEVKGAFEEEHAGYSITYNFAGTPTLRTQIEQGARADVFASANEQQMDLAVQSGVMEGQPIIFASNRLVVVNPGGSDVVSSLQDLAKPGVKLVLALRDVPVGGYARDAIAKMGASGRFGEDFGGRALGNLVSEEVNVRQALSKVVLGEADASIVYTTDVTPEIRSRVDTIDIPDEYNVVALYPVAVVKRAVNQSAAELFIAFLTSDEGVAIMSKHGFGDAP
jgi:molybdate transport system substrate-binding protein